MIGRVYRWDQRYWRVVTRWAGSGPRNVLLEGVLPVGAGPPEGMVDGELGPLRVIDGYLYRATGHHVVRPFRGLRRLA